MAVLIVTNRTIADEMAVTPVIETEEGTEEAVLLLSGIEGIDGRIAFIHGFGALTLDWLEAYTAGIEGCQVIRDSNTLPSDFIVRNEEV